MDNKNDSPDGPPPSPKDGLIDFAGYSTSQLEDLRHTIDGRSHPRNLRNLLAELTRRESDDPQTAAFRDSSEFEVQFTPRGGLIGWLQGIATRSPLYGPGLVRFEGASLALVGWQRNWMGVAQETELRVALDGIHDVEVDDAWISFDAPITSRRDRRIRVQVDNEVAREAVLSKLPRARVAAVGASAAQWREFNRELRRSTPHAWVTGLLLALNIGMFVATVAAGAGFWTTKLELLLRWGANATPLTPQGEEWRLVAAVFLHGGFVHLALNMWVLWGIGRLTERLYGNVLFALIYACCGVAASFTSIAWHPVVNSVGASGAIFGVLGACLAYFLRNRSTVARRIVIRHGIATFAFILFNLIGGLTGTGTDNAAHIGGLLMGLVLGYVIAGPVDRESPLAIGAGRIAAVAAIVTCVIGAGFWQLHRMREDRPITSRYWSAHPWLIEGQTKALRRQAELVGALSQGTTTQNQFVREFEPDVHTFWSSAYERLQAEPESEDLATKDFQADVLEFVRRRHEWSSALLEAMKLQDPKLIQDAVYYLASADQAAAGLNRLELRAAADTSVALSQSRTVRMIRNAVTGFRFECVEERVVRIEGAPTDGYAARHAAGCDAQRHLATENFAALEATMHPSADMLHSFDDGGGPLQSAMAGLRIMFERTINPLPTLAILENWRRDFPDSGAPDLIESQLFQSLAWQARGHGYARDVTPQAWALFAQRLEMAAAALDDAADKPNMSPVWYDSAISLGLDQSKSRGVLMRYADLSLDEFPDYYGSHRQMMRALQPKWGGSYAEIDAYVERVQQKSPAERRAEIYARMYTTLADQEGDDVDIFRSSMVKWPSMKQGYEAMLARYPNSAWIRNLYAGMACRAKDAETFRSVAASLKPKPLPEAWEGKYSIDACNELLEAN